MTTRETATLLLVQEVVMRKLGEQKTAAREAALAEFDQVGVRDIGVLGGEQVGSVQLNKGTTRASVSDMDALIAWATEHLPGEVLLVPTIRPITLSALLSAARTNGVAVTKDGEEIPGITVSQGEPTLMVKPSEDAAEIIGQAFADGRLKIEDLVAPLAVEA